MLFYQVRIYPLVKRALTFMLTYGIRRRYLRVRRAAVLLQGLWNRRKGRNCLPLIALSSSSSSSSSDNEVDPNNNLVCPSPAVLFRGRLLTTPRVIKSIPFNIAAAALIRGAPSAATPIRTKMIAKRLISTDNVNFDSLSATPVKEMKKEPLEQAEDVFETSLPKSPSFMRASQSPSASSRSQGNGQTIKNRPLRVLKKQGKSMESNVTVNNIILPVRGLSEEAELARATAVNTRLNSGYQTCLLTFTDVILPHHRPESPSNRFAKSTETKRKWTDPHHAREMTLQQWTEQLKKEKSPRKRKIKWNHHINFIDEADNPFDPSDLIEARVAKCALRKAPQSTIEKAVDNIDKSHVSVQRILYAPDLEPVKPKKAPKKSRQR